MELQIKNLQASIEGTPILKGVDLTLKAGEIHALMGPNGSGKSTLTNVVFGHPSYEVTGGEVLVNGENILELDPHERARLGLFMAFQYPVEISGVTVGRFLKRAAEIRFGEEGFKAKQFIKRMREMMAFMEIDDKFINRYLNEGFSGGEKKRMEILQLLMLAPEFAILDETDSGLDIDALKVVSNGVNKMRGESFGALIITHYQRILNYIKPDYVHIMYRGRVITSGGQDLVETLEEKGYEWVKQEYGIEEEAHEQPATGG
ncbi:MAG: Fe-S cluster assembly ATPase SufC [Spirochaetes bacterium]|jgi:Fe-S cluster assembly ATP-binding protein|nr:Fe-S cluster assembly ATPase SufC [Spirochaetota bacterium]